MANKNNPAALIEQALAAQRAEEAKMQQKKPAGQALTPADIIAQAQAAQAANQAVQNQFSAQKQNNKPSTSVYDPANPYTAADIIANAIKEQNDYAKKMGYAIPYTESPVITQPTLPSSNTNQASGGLPSSQTAQTQSAPAQTNTALGDKLAAILKEAYENSLAANQTQYDNSIKAMQGAYASGEAKVNDAAKAALREAYISRMLSQRDMAQQLSALGINGGMAETTAAGMLNNYQNNRNGIEADRLAEIGALNDTLLQSLYDAGNQLAVQNAAAAQSYYQQLAQQAIANETPNIKVEKVAYDYRTDPAFIAQYAGVINGTTKKNAVQANYEALVNKYGFNGAKALLAAAK